MDLAAVDHLLTTTRSVRKRLDLTRPVEREVLERAIEIATQAPTGSNAQGWHFVIVAEADKKQRIAALYKQAFDAYAVQRTEELNQLYAADDLRMQQIPRIRDSATYLAEHLHEVPLMVIPCIEGRVENGPVVLQASVYGSILPAVWSLMLALRARGIGSAWTSLHLIHEKEVGELLGIPDHVTQTALLPVAYFKGEGFKPAKRLPARECMHWDAWGKRR